MPLPALLGVLGAATGGEAALAGLNASLGEMTGMASGALREATQLNRNMGLLKGALGDVKQGVVQTLNPLALFNKGMGLTTQAIQAVSAPLLQTTSSLREFQGAVNAVGNSVAQFVEKANPALVTQWRAAVDDWTASIGRALQPALVIATRITRAFADVTFALAGPVQRLLSAFEPLADLIPKITDLLTPAIRSMGVQIDQLARALRPLIDSMSQEVLVFVKMVTVAFTAFVKMVEPAITVLAAMTRNLAEFIRVVGLSQFMGSRTPRDTITGGSRGAAVQQASMGSVEGFQQKALVAGFMSGVGVGGPDYPKASATYLEKIYTLLQNELKQLPASMAKAIVDSLPGGKEGRMAAAAGAKGVDEIARVGVAAGRTLEDRARQFRQVGGFGLGGLLFG